MIKGSTPLLLISNLETLRNMQYAIGKVTLSYLFWHLALQSGYKHKYYCIRRSVYFYRSCAHDLGLEASKTLAAERNYSVLCSITISFLALFPDTSRTLLADTAVEYIWCKQLRSFQEVFLESAIVHFERYCSMASSTLREAS